MPDETTQAPADTAAQSPAAPAPVTPQAPVEATNTTPVDATPATDGSPVTELPITTVDPQPAPSEQGITVVDGPLPAQVTGPPQQAASTVAVQEAVYKSDRVITDTSDPLAVQPLPRSANDLPTLGSPEPPEAVFARSESQS